MSYTAEQIFKARDYAALVVAKHGEAYLPLFERMEREVANLEKKDYALTRARRIAERQIAA